ncbi:MAG: GPW/gp25 family protein [Anaerolineae bacterium]|jgi:phage baseplate assembly protein W|nr:GPW/gp25 family protein [Anaerolineae bacterium]
MQIDYPYHIARNGRTAQTDTNDHIRDMIEQVLFTQPGERVNRPNFGCGLLQMVFGPNSPEIATATQFIVQSSLQQWLGSVIQVNEIDVQSHDSTLSVKVVYTVRGTQQKQQAQFQRQV